MLLTKILKPQEFTAEALAPMFWRAVAGPETETPEDLKPKKLVSARYLLDQLEARGVVVGCEIRKPESLTPTTIAEIMWQEFSGKTGFELGDPGARQVTINQAAWMLGDLAARGVLE